MMDAIITLIGVVIGWALAVAVLCLRDRAKRF